MTITQSGGAGTGLHLVTPCRLFDSRDGSTPLAGAAERQIAAMNLCGIPADAASLVAQRRLTVRFVKEVLERRLAP